YEAHAAAASTREFRDKLQGLRNSPADDRFHNALSVGDLDGARPARGVYVVTHVDVIPPRKDDAVGLLKSLGEASRRDDGNLRYEIGQQTNRPNHFTVIEIWASREAFDAHGMAPHVQDFRDRLARMRGARLIKTGEVIELSHVLVPGMAFFGTRIFNLHTKRTFMNTGRNTRGSNEEVVTSEIGQVGTQFDGFAHQSHGDSLYNCFKISE